MSDSAILVFCTCPSESVAKQLAHQAVQEHVAACVTLLPQVTSIFHWDGELQEDTECLMMLKTTTSKYALLEALLVQQHPYDVPEIVQVPIQAGWPNYLAWLQQSCS